MQKYALINNNVVTGIVEVEADEVSTHLNSNDMVIDITGIIPSPAVGYVLNGNTLEIPQGSSSREQFEIELNSKKVDFGCKLCRTAIDRVGARNKILNKTGTQVITLLTQLLGVKSLLETGALGTARSICGQLLVVYPEYNDIFSMVIAEINSFESTNGL
jgi:hypothetical protein